MVTAMLVPNTAKAEVSSMVLASRSDDVDSDIENNAVSGHDGVAIAPTWESAMASLQARKKRKRPTAMLLKTAMEDLDKIWETTASGKDQDCEAANTLPLSDMQRVQQTTDLLVKVFTQDIHEPAIRALVTNEELKVSNSKLQSELETKQKEVERLRRSEQRSKEAIKVNPIQTRVECFLFCSARVLL